MTYLGEKVVNEKEYRSAMAGVYSIRAPRELLRTVEKRKGEDGGTVSTRAVVIGDEALILRMRRR